MRHLSLTLTVAVLLLSACDMNKPNIKRTSSNQESMKTTTTDIGPEVYDNSLSDGAIIEDDYTIQAEEEPINTRSYERKTYNEKQFSDKESTYPIDKSDRGETFNEKQLAE